MGSHFFTSDFIKQVLKCLLFSYSLEESYKIIYLLKFGKFFQTGPGVVLRARFLIMDSILIDTGIPISLCIHFDKMCFYNYQMHWNKKNS